MSNTFKFLKRCKPEDIEMVSIDKPNDKTKLMAWKLDLENVSKKCCENARKIFVDTKCTGNFNRTGLQSVKNYKPIDTYLSNDTEKKMTKLHLM